jgi:PAS domain S-box-containing protein
MIAAIRFRTLKMRMRTARDSWTMRALTAIGAGVLVVDGGGTILLANARAAAILARPEEQLVGRAIDEVVAPLARLTHDAPESRVEVEVERPGGDRAWLGATLAAFVHDDGRPCYVCLFQDISTLRALRQERDRLQQIAALNVVLPALLHELRNPLAAVEALVEVLLEDADGPLGDDLRAVQGEIQRMGLTLRGVGLLGRDLRTPLRYSDVQGPVHDTLRIMEARAARVRVTLRAKVAELPPLPFDPAVVSAVVFNLVDNAVAACRPGGHVDVRLDVLGGMVEIVVADDGSGMSPEVAARACELFFTTKPHGSGIGLALVTRSVHAGGGRVDITSSPGQGTRVEVRFPLEATLKEDRTSCLASIS